MNDKPILYSFRRCPYAIRARLAIAAGGKIVELREIMLADKAPEFLQASPSGTVPCLKDGVTVIDESLDIMFWALEKSDPESLLVPQEGTLAASLELVELCDGPFKHHLDRYKYDTRYADANKQAERAQASTFLQLLDGRLTDRSWLFGARASLADFAVLPFVRQFANADRDWFDQQDWETLKTWLIAFERSAIFQAVMPKWQKWRTGDEQILFPAA